MVDEGEDVSFEAGLAVRLWDVVLRLGQLRQTSHCSKYAPVVQGLMSSGQSRRTLFNSGSNSMVARAMLIATRL